jgi:hypothetical protein
MEPVSGIAEEVGRPAVPGACVELDLDTVIHGTPFNVAVTFDAVM